MAFEMTLITSLRLDAYGWPIGAHDGRGVRQARTSNVVGSTAAEASDGPASAAGWSSTSKSSSTAETSPEAGSTAVRAVTSNMTL